jgi:alpha-beta hydrolase superfamily lysophospholipase
MKIFYSFFINKNNKKILGSILLLFFILLNALSYRHAYLFTHFDNSKTASPQPKNWAEKVRLLLWGISNPKPTCGETPANYQNILLQNNNGTIACWYKKINNTKGNVILFHGYRGSKRGLLDKAELFLQQGYSVLLVDFYGSACSSGNSTSIGFFEAEDVKTCVDFLQKKTSQAIFLFGTSMGAVAILKATATHQLAVQGLVIECPFGTMQQTVTARFRNMGIPTFPLVHFLLFWGGVQNGFNPYTHCPIDYAKQIKVPTLLLHGRKDQSVTQEEIQTIFDNLQGVKQLHIFEKTGHENYLRKNAKQWTKLISQFMRGHTNK